MEELVIKKIHSLSPNTSPPRTTKKQKKDKQDDNSEPNSSNEQKTSTNGYDRDIEEDVRLAKSEINELKMTI